MSVAGPALVGRERHLREIGLVLDALGVGRGNLLLFTGHAGVGKARLAEEAVDRARASGIAVGWVSCWSDSAAPPCWPWDALLDQLGVGARLAAPAAGTDPGGARFEQFESAWQALRQVAEATPRLLVVDDL